LEEALLKLENERIDLKSAYEKATLTANSRNHIQRRSILQRMTMSDSEKLKEAASPSGQAPGAVDDVGSIREQLSRVEMEVKRKRRELRNWYRSHKKFAVECCPELFQILPDFRTPGSVLGDGGFADAAHVQ
jgi:hypothetical protein